MEEQKKTVSKTKDGLNLKQEEFCQLYATGDRDFFGNGTECYIEVYEPKRVGNWYNSARASASRLLTNVNVMRRINELLESEGFNDESVDIQHLFLINQYADLKTKLGAIKEYNAVKQRVSQRIDVTSGGEKIGGFNFIRPNEDNKTDNQAPAETV